MVPTLQDVEVMRGQHWTPEHIAHAELMLRGLARALELWAVGEGAPDADKWGKKGRTLTLEADVLEAALVRHPDGCAGAELSLFVCTLLACVQPPDLAATLGVPVRVMAAGSRLMGSVALDSLSGGSSWGERGG